MADVVFKSVETLSLVLIGVFASRLNERWHWIVLIAAVLFLVLAQYFQTVRYRAAAARSWFISYLDDSTNLHSTISEIKSHGCGDTWTKGDFIAAIPWWFDEDLMQEWYWMREDADQSGKHNDFGIRQKLRHPFRTLISARFSLERRLAGQSPLKLMESISQLPKEEVTRIVLKAGVERGYLIERQEPWDENDSVVKITYSLNKQAGHEAIGA